MKKWGALGFGLVEVMLASFLFALMVVGVSTYFVNSQKFAMKVEGIATCRGDVETLLKQYADNSGTNVANYIQNANTPGSRSFGSGGTYNMSTYGNILSFGTTIAGGQYRNHQNIENATTKALLLYRNSAAFCNGTDGGGNVIGVQITSALAPFVFNNPQAYNNIINKKKVNGTPLNEVWLKVEPWDMATQSALGCGNTSISPLSTTNRTNDYGIRVQIKIKDTETGGECTGFSVIKYNMDVQIPSATLALVGSNCSMTGTMNSNEPGSLFECSLDNANFYLCDNPTFNAQFPTLTTILNVTNTGPNQGTQVSFTVNDTVDSVRNFYIKSVDSAGNKSTAQAAPAFSCCIPNWVPYDPALYNPSLYCTINSTTFTDTKNCPPGPSTITLNGNIIPIWAPCDPTNAACLALYCTSAGSQTFTTTNCNPNVSTTATGTKGSSWSPCDPTNPACLASYCAGAGLMTFTDSNGCSLPVTTTGTKVPSWNPCDPAVCGPAWQAAHTLCETQTYTDSNGCSANVILTGTQACGCTPSWSPCDPAVCGAAWQSSHTTCETNTYTDSACGGSVTLTGTNACGCTPPGVVTGSYCSGGTWHQQWSCQADTDTGNPCGGCTWEISTYNSFGPCATEPTGACANGDYTYAHQGPGMGGGCYEWLCSCSTVSCASDPVSDVRCRLSEVCPAGTAQAGVTVNVIDPFFASATFSGKSNARNGYAFNVMDFSDITVPWAAYGQSHTCCGRWSLQCQNGSWNEIDSGAGDCQITKTLDVTDARCM